MSTTVQLKRLSLDVFSEKITKMASKLMNEGPKWVFLVSTYAMTYTLYIYLLVVARRLYVLTIYCSDRQTSLAVKLHKKYIVYSYVFSSFCYNFMSPV